MNDVTPADVVKELLEPCWGPEPTASALVIRVVDGSAEMVSLNISAMESIDILRIVLESLVKRALPHEQPSMMQ